MTAIDSKEGRMVLVMGHLAGMIDLVSLPVWVNTLIASYGFSPAQAGSVVTSFLGGVVLASLFWAPRFGKLPGRPIAASGFAVAAVAFFALIEMTDYSSMLILSIVGGISSGTGLSLTHGTIGQSSNPHRLFALATIGLGVYGALFLGVSPWLIAKYGSSALFLIIGATLLVAAFGSGVAFPALASATVRYQRDDPPRRFGFEVWCAILGIMLMTLNQSMFFSFIQRLGLERGFGNEAVAGVLAATGIVAMTPGLLAALLQKSLSATAVAMSGPVMQSACALMVTNTTMFLLYAFPAALMPLIVVFTHIFVFGLLAKLEPSSRAVTSTPAMVMGGSALGPLIGGVVIQFGGYAALGVVITVVSIMALILFAVLRVKIEPVAIRDLEPK